MKNCIVTFIFFCCALSQAKAQTDTLCYSPVFFCSNNSYSYNYCPEDTSSSDTLELWFIFKVGSSGMSSFTFSSSDFMYGYSIWGAYDEPLDTACYAGVDSTSIDYTRNEYRQSFDVTTDVGTLDSGYYYIRIKVEQCESAISFYAKNDGYECPQLECENCIGSFAPIPGNRYLVSTWTKENNASQTKTSYTFPQVYIEFPDTSIVLGPFVPSGQIIDGWQRIEGEFTIPSGVSQIKIKLNCTTGDCFFDDIRIQPYDGSMKTYVYDPVTLRLVAELDERNYATIYEYDEEGKLIRVKKETEKGIMTIQESKTSITK